MTLLDDAQHEERKSLLTTAQCARVLGMSAGFVRGEIEDKRLKARVFKPEGRKRAKYQISADDFTAYVERYWPKAG